MTPNKLITEEPVEHHSWGWVMRRRGDIECQERGAAADQLKWSIMELRNES